MIRKTFVLLLTLVMSFPLMAEKTLIGQWQSAPRRISEHWLMGLERSRNINRLNNDMDSLIMVEELFFIDNTRLEYSIYLYSGASKIEQCVMMVKAEGLYYFGEDSRFYGSLDPSSLKTILYKNTSPFDQSRADRLAEQMVGGLNEFSMTYVTSTDSDNIISFFYENSEMDEILLKRGLTKSELEMLLRPEFHRVQKCW